MLAAPAVSRAKKQNAHEHTGSTGATRPSLRNGFTAYSVLSPESGLVSLRPPGLLDPGVDPSVGGTGPHAFAVRVCLRSSRRPTRPSHPASRFVTIARNVPLHEAGWGGIYTSSGF